jgi:hypothetical protein
MQRFLGTSFNLYEYWHSRFEITFTEQSHHLPLRPPPFLDDCSFHSRLCVSHPHHNAFARAVPHSRVNPTNQHIAYLEGDELVEDWCRLLACVGFTTFNNSYTAITVFPALCRSAYIFEVLQCSYQYSLQYEGKVPSTW